MAIKKHNWTKETMGECAKIHMEQLLSCFFNMRNKEDRQKKMISILLSYFNIEISLKQTEGGSKDEKRNPSERLR